MGIKGDWAFQMVQNAVAGLPVKAMLLGAGFVDAMELKRVSDISSFEVSGSGYTSGGVPVTLAATRSDDELTVMVDCDPVDFGVITVVNVVAIAFYQDLGDPSSPLLVVQEYVVPLSVAGASYTYQPANLGLAALIIN